MEPHGQKPSRNALDDAEGTPFECTVEALTAVTEPDTTNVSARIAATATDARRCLLRRTVLCPSPTSECDTSRFDVEIMGKLPFLRSLEMSSSSKPNPLTSRSIFPTQRRCTDLETSEFERFKRQRAAVGLSTRPNRAALHASPREPPSESGGAPPSCRLHDPVFRHLMVPNLYLICTRLPISHFVDAAVEAEYAFRIEGRQRNPQLPFLLWAHSARNLSPRTLSTPRPYPRGLATRPRRGPP